MRALAVATLASLLLLSSAPAAAQLTNLPVLTERINDTAGVIDAESKRQLDQRIRALKETTGDVVIIATVPSIKPYATVEEYAVKLFEKAGIGQRKIDNGLLILIAVKEHGIRVEVGYGLEGIVTDGFAGDTIRQLIVPEFKANRYGPGLVAGTTHLIDRIVEGRAHPGVAAPNVEAKASDKIGWPGIVLFVIICLTVIAFIVGVIYLIAKATGGARSTPAGSGFMGSGGYSDDYSSTSSSSSDSSSSSSDSGSSGFDGGSSGGGGASGSW